MKRNNVFWIVSLILSLTCSRVSMAQVFQSYTITSSLTGSYQSLTSATSINIPLMGAEANFSVLSTMVSIPIGFNFWYNGNSYNSFIINRYGAVSLGNGTFTTTSIFANPLSNSNGLDNSISVLSSNNLPQRNLSIHYYTSNTTVNVTGGFLSQDIVGKDLFNNTYYYLPPFTEVTAVSTSPSYLVVTPAPTGTEISAISVLGDIKYKLYGTAPNRHLAVEFAGYTQTFIDFSIGYSQLILNESDYSIDFWYGINNGTMNAEIGLRGNSASDVNILVAKNNWTSLQTSSLVGSNTAFSSSNWPTYGQMITYMAPPPCNGVPVSGTTTLAPKLTCYPDLSQTITLEGGTNAPGIVYQWQSSANSIAGFTNVSNAITVPFLTTISSSLYYRSRIVCQNSGDTVYSSPILVKPFTALNTPYKESFENITQANQLPICMSASNLGNTCLTYTTTANYNRVPISGHNFASFSVGSASNSYFYSPAVWLSADSIYKASVWYITSGYLGWKNFSINYGTTNLPSGLTTIASAPLDSAGYIENNTYAQISGTFTPTVSGVYYFVIEGSYIYNPAYLSFDSITVEAVGYIPITGISKSDLDNKLLVYPNPSNGTFVLEVSKPGTYTITDLIGRTVSYSTIENSTIVHGLDNGFYLLKFISNSGNASLQKLIVEK